MLASLALLGALPPPGIERALTAGGVSKMRFERYDPDLFSRVGMATGEHLSVRLVDVENSAQCVQGIQDARRAIALTGSAADAAVVETLTNELARHVDAWRGASPLWTPLATHGAAWHGRAAAALTPRSRGVERLPAQAGCLRRNCCPRGRRAR